MALWVENEARRANRNLLLVNGLIVAILVLIVAGNYHYCELRARMQAGIGRGTGRHPNA